MPCVAAWARTIVAMSYIRRVLFVQTDEIRITYLSFRYFETPHEIIHLKPDLQRVFTLGGIATFFPTSQENLSASPSTSKHPCQLSGAANAMAMYAVVGASSHGLCRQLAQKSKPSSAVSATRSKTRRLSERTGTVVHTSTENSTPVTCCM